MKKMARIKKDDAFGHIFAPPRFAVDPVPG
jgi:hypothetical protein